MWLTLGLPVCMSVQCASGAAPHAVQGWYVSLESLIVVAAWGWYIGLSLTVTLLGRRRRHAEFRRDRTPGDAIRPE